MGVCYRKRARTEIGGVIVRARTLVSHQVPWRQTELRCARERLGNTQKLGVLAAGLPLYISPESFK